ncbi:MAG: hypothetical protein V8T17_04465 [Oscillospiraceae bacterium]
MIHKGEKFILLVHAAAIVDKNAGARHLAAGLILADLYGEKRLAEKRRAALRFKAQRQMECLSVRFVGELRALRVDVFPRLANPTAVNVTTNIAASRSAAVMRLRRFGFGISAGCFSISTLSQ